MYNAKYEYFVVIKSIEEQTFGKSGRWGAARAW